MGRNDTDDAIDSLKANFEDQYWPSLGHALVFYKDEADIAKMIACDYLDEISPEKIIDSEKRIEDIFEGCSGIEIKGSGPLSKLIATTLDSEIYRSPISIFRAAYSSSPVSDNGKTFLCCLAILVKKCYAIGEKAYWPDMITASLLISAQILSENYGHKKAAYIQKLANLERVRPAIEGKNEQALNNRNYVHSLASEYLQSGKSKRDIATLICKKMNETHSERGLRIRRIRQLLEDHDTGMWKPKKRKK